MVFLLLMAYNKDRAQHYKSIHSLEPLIEEFPYRSPQIRIKTRNRKDSMNLNKEHEVMKKNGYISKFSHNSAWYRKGIQTAWNTIE